MPAAAIAGVDASLDDWDVTAGGDGTVDDWDVTAGGDGTFTFTAPGGSVALPAGATLSLVLTGVLVGDAPGATTAIIEETVLNEQAETGTVVVTKVPQ